MHIHLSGIEYGPKGEKNHLAARESGFGFFSAFPGIEKVSVATAGFCVKVQFSRMMLCILKNFGVPYNPFLGVFPQIMLNGISSGFGPVTNT